MKKSKGQFDHYKKWTTENGYTFLAKDQQDAEEYLKMNGIHLGSLKEVVEDEEDN
jgi:hypothetical protein|tara:strand:- start:1137 stop:1301 length:165 start_codon:yes stop_codon:yes gene_type:complete